MHRDQEALDYHSEGRPGKLEVIASKPCSTQRDLSLAYTPGVAVPCRRIHDDPEDAYKYTGKGNLVAVISNGTAVLGLGDIGALAGKPVMEGKGVLFKRFAGIDVFDLEIDSHDPEEIIRLIKLLEPTFGGINLEDIKAPECFHIEQTLKKEMGIPVLHDDQHGAAIISGAALINAIEIAGKEIEEVTLVCNGAGAAGIACANFYISLGVKREHLTLCDSEGVIYRGREVGMNPYKEKLATDRDVRANEINEAMKRAAARALADLAKEDVPDSVAKAYGVERLEFGPDYLIPKPLDHRVLIWEAAAVAQAAIDSGVAQVEIDLDLYKERLERLLGKSREVMRIVINQAKSAPKRVVFPEGQHEKVLRAAQIVIDEGLALPILLGSETEILRSIDKHGFHLENVTIIDPATSRRRDAFAQALYELRQRRGLTLADAWELLPNPTVFGALMVHLGDADALVAGVGQHYSDTLRPALQIIGRDDSVSRVAGLHLMLVGNKVYFFADTAVTPELIDEVYPFSTLERGANVLVFPDLQSANVAYKLVQRLGGAEAIGPILMGIRKPVHMLYQGSEVKDIVHMTALAVVDAQEGNKKLPELETRSAAVTVSTRPGSLARD